MMLLNPVLDCVIHVVVNVLSPAVENSLSPATLAAGHAIVI